MYVDILEFGDDEIFRRAAEALTKESVYVGVPQENSSRKGEEITNAELMFIHTNGSPMRNIPPRPTIEPAIEENEEQIAELLKQAALTVFDGRGNGYHTTMDQAGAFAENAVITKFGSGDLAPLSEKTVLRKGSSAPLIDTGALKAAVTHVVEGE